MRNNPLRYVDPSGHWGETFLDIAFIAYDIYDINANGLNWENGLALTADVGCAILPIATGGGMAVRALSHADVAVKVASHIDDATHAIELAGHMGDGAHAVLTASRLKQVGVHSDEGVRLVKALAEQSTKGAGERVVLGKWIEGGGYIAEAKKNGGIFFETAEGVYDALGRDAGLAWEVNEQFLRNQLESGVSRIDFVGESIGDVEKYARGTMRWREIQFLKQNASRYGYELIGNSWIKVK